MLLTIDVGNTNTVFGLFEGDGLKKVWRVPSSQREIRLWIKGSKKKLGRVDGIIISNVVPSLRQSLQEIGRVVRTRPLFVGSGLKMPIRLKVKNPNQVGADRIVNAVAAYTQWGLSRGRAQRAAPLLVIDFGTATTFDLVTPDGDFIGGVIVPGLEILREALAERCEKLPFVRLTPPQRVIGRTTNEAIRSGLLFGYAGLVDSLVDKIQKELGRRCRVIATGGLATRITPLTSSIQIVDQHLTLKGLQRVYDFN